MASSDKEVTKDGEEGEQVGFLGKVKDFIHDIGEKIEEAVGFGKPTADVTAIHIPSIDLKKAELVVDILIANPNPIPIPLVDINYLVESDGRKLVSGLIPDSGTIHAHGSETLKIPVTLIYDDIKETYNDIEPGSVIPYKVRIELIVDIPVIGNITLPMEKTGEIPVPYKPEVDLEKIKFDQFSFEETSATLHLKLDNKNDFDLGLNALEYEVCLAEVNIGGACLSKSAKIGKKGQGIVELPISFRPKDFGSAMWEMIRGRGTGYSMKGNLDVDTPFGPMKLPFSREGGNTRLKKAEDEDDEDIHTMFEKESNDMHNSEYRSETGLAATQIDDMHNSEYRSETGLAVTQSVNENMPHQQMNTIHCRDDAITTIDCVMFSHVVQYHWALASVTAGTVAYQNA
ncbi:hypothetical protein HHK36_008436 [Tetracentron sinense]|uniref:Water stress and hypersensitive response domain-containing protein n=1 Tax=Tetracentron sinense TaxID=13715 RepID=A0A834ZFG0_TETSI|nr:hypothetical protein HHK36_008436 [Tetracentron sinense]